MVIQKTANTTSEPDGQPGTDARLARLTQLRMSAARPEAAEVEATRGEGIKDLFAALESPLLSYALRLLPGAAVAEDVVQEAFLRLHARFGEVREPRPWLYRTVHNLAMNHQRQAARLVPLVGQPGEEPVGGPELVDLRPLPDEEIARWEAVGLVRLGLETLDARSREIVQLKFDQDLSYEEISARTGLSVGHVGYLLHHAVKSLAAELTKAGLLP